MVKLPDSPMDFDFSKFLGDFAKFPTADFSKMMGNFKGPAADFTKLMGDFKVPGLDMQSFMVAQRRNMEALTSANKLALEGIQALFKRQMEIIREAIEENSAAANELNSAGTPQEKAVKQTEFAKHYYERALANSRELAEMAAKSNAEAFELLNKRFAAALDEMKVNISKANGAAKGGDHK